MSWHVFRKIQNHLQNTESARQSLHNIESPLQSLWYIESPLQIQPFTESSTHYLQRIKPAIKSLRNMESLQHTMTAQHSKNLVFQRRFEARSRTTACKKMMSPCHKSNAIVTFSDGSSISYLVVTVHGSEHWKAFECLEVIR